MSNIQTVYIKFDSNRTFILESQVKNTKEKHAKGTQNNNNNTNNNTNSNSNNYQTEQSIPVVYSMYHIYIYKPYRQRENASK